MNTVRIVIAAAAVAAIVVEAGPAGADPAPPPGPYQIITPSGPQIGGLPNYPAICGVQPRSCNFNWSPDTGAWQAPPPDQ